MSLIALDLGKFFRYEPSFDDRGRNYTHEKGPKHVTEFQQCSQESFKTGMQGEINYATLPILVKSKKKMH